MIKDINNFNVEEYPEIKKATPIRFTVNEGETVFIPAGWWHSTKMTELSISIAESTLDRGNWDIRRDWCFEGYRQRGASKSKMAALNLYMHAMRSFVN